MHGYIRATNALDVFIGPTVENARAVYAASLALGGALKGIEPEDLLNDEENLRFGPVHDHIDLCLSRISPHQIVDSADLCGLIRSSC